MRLFKPCLNIIFFMSFFVSSIAAQNPPSMQDLTPPCVRPELDQIAFLEGEWEVVSEMKSSSEGDEWEESKAVASWTPILNGCALQEKWSGTLNGEPMEWFQLLAYNQRDEKWEQGMVDWAHGNLITSDGYYQEEGKLVFTTPHMRSGKLLIDKIIIEKVSEKRVNWTIKTSLDGGETWTTFWKMRYTK